MKRPQLGAGGIFIFIVVLLAMVAITAVFTLSNMRSSVDLGSQTRTSLANAAAALEQFASQTGRLPCPADPTLDTGLAVPNTATVNCTNPDGTVPWATIGMRRDDAIDAWGWKIGYRVYNGNGGMTQANGASMVNCDTSQALILKQPVDGNQLCPAAHDTLDTDFIAGKGLSVTDFGTVYDGTKASGGAAYVLISFGPSGFGAYTSSGSANPNTPSSTDEKNNLKATGPFVLEAASAPSVPPNDNSHYDDILLYRTIADLAKKANLAARNWPDDVLAGARFDQTTVQNALGASPSGDLGVTTLDFGNFSVSAFDSGGAQDLAFTSGSTSGLGGVSGGGNNLTSTGGEGLQFNLDDPARQFSVSLANFNIGFFGSDRAQLTFYSVSGNTATKIGTDVVKTACGFSSTASFTVDLGATGITDPTNVATFNRVEIRPITQTGFGAASTFRVEEIRTCIFGVTCQTSIYNSGDKC